MKAGGRRRLPNPAAMVIRDAGEMELIRSWRWLGDIEQAEILKVVRKYAHLMQTCGDRITRNEDGALTLRLLPNVEA